MKNNYLASISVNIPLANAETTAISQTPFSFQTAVSINKKTTGKTSVPNIDTINDRTGLSSAVKKEEKHISIHPAR